MFGTGQQVNLESGEIGVHSTPTVAGDVVIIGSAMREGATVSTHNNTKGLVRAFDVKTGRKLWQFDTIARPGTIGSETWEENSWAFNGNTGVWTQISVDEEAGLVYLPIETPTSDFYGGHRPGNNLFSESIVAVDLKTGQRKWHFQQVHHPLWNFDNCCASLLADIVVDGKPIKALAQPSKIGWLYVLDRITGQPVWPIEERPVPKSEVPGEKASPTQPFVTKPPAYARTYMKVPDDLIDFTPEMRQQALEVIKRYKYEPTPFNPPILGNLSGILGAIGASTATNWPGSAYDPETHTVFAQAGNLGASARSLVAPPAGFSDIRYVSGTAGRPFREVMGPGDCCAADAGRKTREEPAPTPAPTAAAAPAPAPDPGLTVQGLPISKPPYGVLSAVNLDRGELLWQVAARRDTGQHPQPPGAARNEHPEDRPGGHLRRRADGDQNPGGHGRSAGHLAARTAARRDAARLRQENRPGGRRALDARPAERLADDLLNRRQAVHRRRGQRWRVLGRVPRVQSA